MRGRGKSYKNHFVCVKPLAGRQTGNTHSRAPTCCQIQTKRRRRRRGRRRRHGPTIQEHKTNRQTWGKKRQVEERKREIKNERHRKR